jgi:hypothetical protein
VVKCYRLQFKPMAVGAIPDKNHHFSLGKRISR